LATPLVRPIEEAQEIDFQQARQQYKAERTGDPLEIEKKKFIKINL
jgi:hypothetical protein